MTPQSARRIIIGSVAITATSTTVSSVRKGDAPRPRVFLGAALLAAILTAAAGAAPGLAAGTAVLVALGSLLAQVDALPSIITGGTKTA